MFTKILFDISQDHDVAGFIEKSQYELLQHTLVSIVILFGVNSVLSFSSKSNAGSLALLPVLESVAVSSTPIVCKGLTAPCVGVVVILDPIKTR